MALSESVLNSLQEAEASLRNALSFAARQERPCTCSSIGKLLVDIDHIRGFDDVMDSIEKLKNEL